MNDRANELRVRLPRSVIWFDMPIIFRYSFFKVTGAQTKQREGGYKYGTAKFHVSHSEDAVFKDSLNTTAKDGQRAGP